MSNSDRAGQRLDETADSSSPPVTFPVSFAQQRLWFLDQLKPGIAAYNLPLALRLRGALDVAALEKSVSEVLRRHDALRTVFPVRDGQPVQAISPPRPVGRGGSR